MDNMIINGHKLAQYLHKYKVGRSEFIDALTEGNEIKSHYNDEDNMTEYYKEKDGVVFESDLFNRHGVLDYEHAVKFVDLIGADDAIDLIDWEVMGIEKPKKSASESRCFIAIFDAIRSAFTIRNARKSYAI